MLKLIENWLVYRPMRHTKEWLDPPNARVVDLQLASADGTGIHAWWCPVEDWEPAKGAMLYCHGNAGNLSHRAEVIKGFQELLGESILIFDYPGYGRSGGRPSEAGCYAAADAAYDWLTQAQGVAPEHILIYGKSLGGGVAVELASRRPYRALVLAKTFTSIPDTAQSLYPWLPVRWLVRNRFENLEKIVGCSQPVFVTHGTADRLVPFSHGERLFAAAKEPKSFYPMVGCDHGDPLEGQMLMALKRFLERNAPLPVERAATVPSN